PCRRTRGGRGIHARTRSRADGGSQKRPRSQGWRRHRPGRTRPKDEPAIQDSHPSRRTGGDDQSLPPQLSADQIYTAEQAELRPASQEVPAADKPADFTEETIYTE